jgi:hypothetical protein
MIPRVIFILLTISLAFSIADTQQSITHSENDQLLADRSRIVEMWIQRGNPYNTTADFLSASNSSSRPPDIDKLDRDEYVIGVIFIFVLKLAFVIILFRCLHKISKNVERCLLCRKRKNLSSDSSV